MNNFFNPRRFGLLIKNEIFSDYKTWLTYLITIVGVYTGIAILMGVAGKVSGGFYNYDLNVLNYSMFPGFLFLGGYIASSLAYSDANDKFKSSIWFSLPGSALEKYSVGILISGIGYVVFVILAFVLASTISNIFTRPIFGYGLAVFNPFTLTIDESMNFPMGWLLLIYLLSHSMFLVGSITFKKAAFIKTVLVAFAVQIALSTILSLIGWIIIKTGLAYNWDLRVIENFFRAGLKDGDEIFRFYIRVSVVIGVILSLFFNTVGYFKLREKEVKGGI